MNKIIFDVGANDGMTFFNEAKNGATVYAFEPVPELIVEILKTLRADPCASYNLVAAAVSDEETVATKLNIAGWHEMGCSSLNEFSDNLDRSTAPFVTTHSILIPTIRMDSFIREMNISKIDYLHIDTQGHDLKVLKSFGDELHRVIAGVMEVPNRVHLYKTMHGKQESIDFLQNNGFAITKIENNGGDDAEQNVFFERKAI